MLNKTILQGRLTKDPEYGVTGSNVPYANITIAWSEKYKEIEKKCFLRCKAWRGTADFLKNFFSKGQDILVEGELITEEWEQDGQKCYDIKLYIDKVHFCGKKADKENDSFAVPESTAQNKSEGNLPF